RKNGLSTSSGRTAYGGTHMTQSAYRPEFEAALRLFAHASEAMHRRGLQRPILVGGAGAAYLFDRAPFRLAGPVRFPCGHSAPRRQAAMSRENPAIAVEALGRHDLPAALDLQKAAYPSFLVEGEGAFLSRIELAASYCLAAKHGEALLGYLLAHGWKRQSPPPLGTVLAEGVPSEVLFIHDLAVASAKRG